MPKDIHGTTVTTYLDPHDVVDIDTLALLDGVTRSAWIREAVRAELARRLPSQEAVLKARREVARLKASAKVQR